jgi:hypothetical protein
MIVLKLAQMSLKPLRPFNDKFSSIDVACIPTQFLDVSITGLLASQLVRFRWWNLLFLRPFPLNLKISILSHLYIISTANYSHATQNFTYYSHATQLYTNYSHATPLLEAIQNLNPDTLLTLSVLS